MQCCNRVQLHFLQPLGIANYVGDVPVLDPVSYCMVMGFGWGVILDDYGVVRMWFSMNRNVEFHYIVEVVELLSEF